MVRSKMLFYIIREGRLPNLRDDLAKMARNPKIRDMKLPVYFQASNARYAYTSAEAAERRAKRLHKVAQYLLV